MRKLEITVYGLVQGVGFRPFVAEAAQEFSVSGTVKNAGGIVKITCSGDDRALDGFIRRLSSCDIPGAEVADIVVNETDIEISDGFNITESSDFDDQLRVFPADIATCDECEKELLDPNERRFRYPFLSCVSCGPRYTIMSAVPYDRERTAMLKFPMCEDCTDDYNRHFDRRRYAQTIACEKCGPKVSLYTDPSIKKESYISDDAVKKTVELLKSNKIVAIKDIGGYHYAFDATNEEAAKRLREYKHRETKPFAIMFPDVESVNKYCEINDTEKELLLSPARPIVLLDKKEGMDFAPSVCSMSFQIGAMLPCNPLQILILKECGPLVMTSANLSGEPIITDDKAILDEFYKGFPDAVLSNNREILNGLDDSVCQVVSCDDGYHIQIIRRARGYVPEPIRIKGSSDKDLIASGSDLKAVFALMRKNHVYLSGHFGDLDDMRALKAWEAQISHMENIFSIKPDNAICDKHPAFHSSNHIKDNYADVISIQHHHAHVLSVVAEHGLTGPVLGVAYDGTGYGDDGSIWGSEFLYCEKDKYTRIAHGSVISMIGGDASAKNAVTSLYAYMYAALNREIITEDEISEVLRLLNEDKKDYNTVFMALEHKVNVVYSSSMGRLFDAVSALLGTGRLNSYEGECAIRLQASAEKWLYKNNTTILDEVPEVWAPVSDDTIDTVYLISVLIKQRLYGSDASELAAHFHMAIADATYEMCEKIIDKMGDVPVVLSGGTMYNRLILKRLMREFKSAGRNIFINEKVPCGDGGIALGQAYFACLTNGGKYD